MEKIIKFIQETFRKQGFTKAIVAVSGGIDSATSLMLAVKALGKDNVYSFQLPYKKHQLITLADSVIAKAGIPKNQRLVINIGRPADKLAVKLNAKNVDSKQDINSIDVLNVMRLKNEKTANKIRCNIIVCLFFTQ